MSFRIIGGELRNRVLKSPKGEQTRPTSAILRKAVFDICKEYIDGAGILDVFAGTGAIGIEALSRGASHATFIDNNKNAIRCIQENILQFKLEKQTTVMMGAALNLLERLEKLKKQFDIIYIDPPYGAVSDKKSGALIIDVLKLIDEGHLLKKEAIVFAEEEYPSKSGLEEIIFSKLILKDRRKFGKSLLHQYRLLH